MKQTAWIALVFVVTLAVALWALKVFDQPTSDAPPGTPTTPVKGSGDLAAPTPDDGVPTVEPVPEVPAFAQPADVLLLGDSHRSFGAWLEMNWDFAPAGIRWRAWYARPAPSGVELASHGVTPLDHAPTAADVDAMHVLVLAGLDPKAFPAEFWAHVADRVADGKLGLLVVAEDRFAHATANEPSLAKVLPVAGSKAILPDTPGGREFPGLYRTPATFHVTEAGTKHAATRLVSWPIWSKRLWDEQMSSAADGRWDTKFAAAVEGPAKDAVVLVDVGTGKPQAPAILASDDPKRRVLWVGGFFDLGDPAYLGSKSGLRFRSLAISWIAWLAGATV